MEGLIGVTGPNRAVEIFGIKLAGVNAENGRKLLFTLAFVVLVMLLSRLLRWLTRAIFQRRSEGVAFWSRQAIHLLSAIVLIIGIVSIWFDNPARIATALGLVTAGLAFALQRVITAVAGYFVLLRGKNFTVGDRITMGGVRGDVMDLGFIQTTIMEMGQAPGEQEADPAMWVKSRQYTGRIVTVSNALIFDEPVYNYTKDFPYLWEEMSLPIRYDADRSRAEDILHRTGEKHTVGIKSMSQEAIQEMKRRYFIEEPDMGPRVYYQLTDNWLLLTLRFICKDHGIRELKDAMSREILAEIQEAKIEVASATFELVGTPTVKVDARVAGSESAGSSPAR